MIDWLIDHCLTSNEQHFRLIINDSNSKVYKLFNNILLFQLEIPAFSEHYTLPEYNLHLLGKWDVFKKNMNIVLPLKRIVQLK